MNGAKEIANQRRGEHRIVTGKPGFVRKDAAVEGLSHVLRMFAYAEVADPYFAQRAVEIGEHSVEKALANPARLRPFGLEPVKVKECMEANQLKTPVKRVWHAMLHKEDRLASLIHDPLIRDIGGLSRQITCRERKQCGRSHAEGVDNEPPAVEPRRWARSR